MNIVKLRQEISQIIQDEVKTENVMEAVLKYKKEEEEERKEKIVNGIRAAQDKGIVFGRPRKKIPAQFEVVYEIYVSHRLSSRSAAKMLNVAQSTFLKWCSEHVN